MPSTTLEIDALEELGSLDEKGKPVTSRLKDVKSAVTIYGALKHADEQSSYNRARVDATSHGACRLETWESGASRVITKQPQIMRGGAFPYLCVGSRICTAVRGHASGVPTVLRQVLTEHKTYGCPVNFSIDRINLYLCHSISLKIGVCIMILIMFFS